MPENPLQGLTIRTAVVLAPDLGFVYAGDPAKEEDEVPHAITFRWYQREFSRGECNYDVQTACFVEQPQRAVINASEPGYYSANTRSGTTTGDIFENSFPRPRRPRSGGVRALSEIGGQAYAVGLRGMVYRLDSLERWTRIDDGLPDTFNIQAVHGFGPGDIYAAGRHGQLWHYDGGQWTRRELPTNANLTAVHCAANDKVYLAGHRGLLIAGRGDDWETIDQQETRDDLWDLVWFEDVLYASTMSTVYRLVGEGLERVDFGQDPPATCAQLSAATGVLWSIGEHDIVAFDGSRWTRIV